MAELRSVSVWHLRTAAGKEADFILEGEDGRIEGIEVEASVTLRHRDSRA